MRSRHDAERPAPSGRWSLRVFSVCLVLAWVMPTTYVLRFYLPYNASVLSRSAPSFLLLVPEGWGFFTRDPREMDFFAYRRDESGKWEVMTQWALGFSRRGRILAREAALASESIGTRTDCRGDHASCLNGIDADATIETTFPDAAVCGDIGFVWQEPVPWAWARSAVVMPLQVGRIEVSC